MTDVILMSDGRVARIPVIDCGETLADLGLVANAPWVIDNRLADETGEWRLTRSGVADRLRQAAARLPDGLQLRIIEAYRPATLQTRYFDDYLAQVVQAYPGVDVAQARVLASRYISPPELAPHSAGAAIDLTLATTSGVELDMGTVYDATPEASAGACYTESDIIDDRARANRAVLRDAMGAGGFVNYPTEWWHWSYGDRYWALMTEHPHALYGAITP